MARSTSSTRQLIPSSSSTPTITLETASSSQQQQQPQIRESLVLKLKPAKKRVTWKEGTVDNEFMNKKSSKKCCIFHKDKTFDEDDSDSEADCGHDHDKDDKHSH